MSAAARRAVMNRLAASILGAAATLAAAQEFDSMPAYRPEQEVAGTLRIRGDNGQGAMLKLWQEGFAKFHPNARFDSELLSTAHALPALYLGLADVGLIGREELPIENLAFRRVYRYDPTEIAIATGSYDTPYRSYAFAIYVNKDNPLERITISQLRSIYGCGPGKHIRTWGDLGLGGEWADKPIHVSGYATGTNLAIFFELKVLAAKAAGGQGLPEGVMWNCDLKQYGTTYAQDTPGGAERAVTHADAPMLKDLSEDKHGIAYAGVFTRQAGVKRLALAAQDGGPYVEISRETVQGRTWPLTRTVYMYINKPVDKPLDPKVREFMRYVLSREGQEAVTRQKVYLPLTAQAAAEQRRKLD
jgi:phosphate transport system substrate-binding protein